MLLRRSPMDECPSEPSMTSAVHAIVRMKRRRFLLGPRPSSRVRSDPLIVALGGTALATTMAALPVGPYPFAVAWGGATLALNRLARGRERRVSVWGLAAMMAVVPVTAIADGWVEAAIAVGAVCVAWAWGDAGRVRQLRRQAEMRDAVRQERRRIARELHDVIAHNVSMMVVQATAAEDGFDKRPEQAREALGAISSAGRTALSELRRMLALVRPEADEDPDVRQSGLESLDQLAASLRAVGLAVSVREVGPNVRIAAGVDMSAYRIVQEALTNTLRHARANHAEVIVRYGCEALEIEISDDGTASGARSGASEGRGILGMRERAELLGGALEAGPDPDGGFRVRAVLPLEITS